jgi:hypothetical protein
VLSNVGNVAEIGKMNCVFAMSDNRLEFRRSSRATEWERLPALGFAVLFMPFLI